MAASQEESEQQTCWQAELEQLIAKPEEPLAIRSFVGLPMETASKPVRAMGVDGKTYVVKGQQAGRQIVNDQIVGYLGVLLGAPVGNPCIVEVDEILTNDPDEPEFAYFQPGLAHATQFIPDTVDDRDMRHYQGQAVNRDRFARLSVLYGWVGAADHQFLYNSQPPNAVHSVDHGHFFPHGPDWTINDLLTAPPAVLDPKIVNVCRFQPSEIQKAMVALVNLSEKEILQAVARPPVDWGITIRERVALVDYLVKRRQELLKTALGSIRQGETE